MKLQFKEQEFQVLAVKAVVDCFAGQTLKTNRFTPEQIGYSNSPIQVTETQLLKNIREVQKRNDLHESQEIQRPKGTGLGFHLTIEMETGTGKTYTYIRTMYELHKHYGWSKFIVIVPGIAIREGVYKSFQVTQQHFQELYGHKINPFIYNSGRPQDIDNFASDNRISVMIINTQAFNASGADARRIYQELDRFGTRKPIDIIAETNPILIIDEPQSVDGERTLQSMQDFNPLFTLRYSATHKVEYNKIYRLDALDAYNKRLVKKIQVKGITQKGSTGTTGYLYLEQIRLSTTQPPYAVVEFEKRTGGDVRKVRQKLNEGADLYELSGNLPAYKNQAITEIDGYRNKIVVGGQDIYPGDILNDKDENAFRRVQIRECILSHLQKEKQLFEKGIKVLSLFFIDSVEKYRLYDETGEQGPGEYAKIFEEEYNYVRNDFFELFQDEYSEYLKRDDANKVHEGYFSIDKKGKSVNPAVKRGSEESEDTSAYDLIMKDKERLLSFEEPTRFIFSHSALKEGWDNPNVFQICALKNAESGSHTRRRQEVGRGMRLCVNKNGNRLDVDAVGDQVHEINKLTVVASESYEAFARGLQSEIAATLKDRPYTGEPFKPVDERQSIIPDVNADFKKTNGKTNYEVRFDTDQLINDCKIRINARLHIDDRAYEVRTGEMEHGTKEQMVGGSLVKESKREYLQLKNDPHTNAVYDIVGEIEALTSLTRTTIVAILKAIEEEKFLLFRKNPEEFIAKCSKLINEVKAGLIINTDSQ